MKTKYNINIEKIFFILLTSNLLYATPTKPSNLYFSNITSKSLTINWQDNSSNETGFKIFRDDKLIKLVPENTQSYIDTNLKPNTIYKYTIKATDDPFIKSSKLDPNYYLSNGFNLVKKDLTPKTFDELKDIWGLPQCISNSRVQILSTNQNNSFYKIIVKNGENYKEGGDNDSVQRCELGVNEHRPKGYTEPEWDGYKIDETAFILYKEGEHAITLFSIKLNKDFPLNSKKWQSIMQMKQTQPSNNDGTPIISLHAEDGKWKLVISTKKYETIEKDQNGNIINTAGETGTTSTLWETEAKRDIWTKFAFDIFYSSNPTKGYIQIYIDKNGDGDILDQGEVSPKIHLATLKYETKDSKYFKQYQSIPSHLRIGVYNNSAINCKNENCSIYLDNIFVLKK